MTLPVIELGLNRPLPIEITSVTAPFWEGLAEGQFRVARCAGCDRLCFPPRAICPECHGRMFTWQPLCGRGTLYAESKVQQSPPVYGILSPMRVAVVDLEEGIRIVTRLLPSVNPVRLDSAVELVVTSHPDGYHYAVRIV
jgi:uncharacterized OB-fold protein